MRVPNPMPFFGKVRAQVLLKNGSQYTVSTGTDRDFEVEDDAVEVVIISSGTRGRMERVWTPDRGLQDKDAYFQHKELKQQVETLQAQKEKMLRDKAKATKREKVQAPEDEVSVVKSRVSSEERRELCDRVESETGDSR